MGGDRFRQKSVILINFSPTDNRRRRNTNQPTLILSIRTFGRLKVALITPVARNKGFTHCTKFDIPLRYRRNSIRNIILIGRIQVVSLHTQLTGHVNLTTSRIIRRTLLHLRTIIRWNIFVCHKRGGALAGQDPIFEIVTLWRLVCSLHTQEERQFRL